jgi:hypothetical protein
MEKVTLTTTWQPRGETLRLRRLYPYLARLYHHIIVVMPPKTHAGMVLSFRVYDKLTVVVAGEWAAGRYTALEKAVEANTPFIHYADMDRMIRWAETLPRELLATVDKIRKTKCLVIGRTDEAYATHPQALIQTEAMSNRVFSHILNQKLDLSSGSKGFRRDVVQHILKNSQPSRALGTDSEWVILAKRGGFELTDYRVRGLDWESADRYSTKAADEDQQRQAAAEYDANSKNWKRRVEVADEIINAGLDALKRPLK